MHLLLSFVAAVTAAVNSIGIRLFQEKVQKNRRDLQAYQTLYIFLSSVVFLLISGFRFPVTTEGRLLTIGFGLALALSTIGMAESFLCGPMSLSSVIISCNVLMPIVYGCLVYRESIGIFHLLGIMFLLATFVLTGIGAKEGKRGISLKWILLVLTAFFGNGLGAIIETIYSRLPEANNNNGFMSISFFLGSLMLLGYVTFSGRNGRKKQEPVCVTLPFVGLAVWAALGCFVTNMLLLYLCGEMPASLLYPVYNGVNGVLVTVFSCVFFREKMDRKKLLMILLGICAVVFLNL